MLEETKKTLSDLYAIRATMSLVAKKDDEAGSERAAITALKEKQLQADTEVQNLNNSFGEKLYEIKEQAREKKDKLAEEQESKKTPALIGEVLWIALL